MQYEEFLTLTGETQQTVSLDFYKNEIEPRYMMFDGLSKEAFCRIYAATMAFNEIDKLGERMKRGFKTQAEMATFWSNAETIITKINNAFKN